jgi:hypothetical protein
MSEKAKPWYPYPEGTVFDIAYDPINRAALERRQVEIQAEAMHLRGHAGNSLTDDATGIEISNEGGDQNG